MFVNYLGNGLGTLKLLSSLSYVIKVHSDRFESPIACAKHVVEGKGSDDGCFFVFDLDAVVRKYAQWRQLLPTVEMHYAMKCSDRREILQVLAALGSSFDCASKGEISQVLALGVEPSRIIFANPCKLFTDISYAAAVGVELTTFDSESELKKIKEINPAAKLLIRFKCGSLMAATSLDSKYGCDPVTEAPQLLKVAAELGLHIVGVCFHVGSGCEGDAAIYRKAISVARTVFDLAVDYGHKVHILDIGGGYQGHGTSMEDEVASVINSALEEYFPDPSVRVLGEPGRFVATSTLTAVAKIIGKRIVQEAAGPLYMYYATCGYFNGLNTMHYEDTNPKTTPLMSSQDMLRHRSSVWGPTCDSTDIVCRNLMLPELEVGEWVAFEDVGHYSLTIATNFNGFPSPKVYTMSTNTTCDRSKELHQLKETYRDWGPGT